MVRRRVPRHAVPVKSAAEVELMRQAGAVVAEALHVLGKAIRPGVTTGELDAIAEETIRARGAVPAFLGYNGFPATACISINEEVVHGIPGARELRAGDIVGVDLGAVVSGWYGDAAWTFPVGEVSLETQRLLAIGQEALRVAIAATQVGHRVRDIGAAVLHYVDQTGCSVVRDLCGHGIGRRLHEEPQVPNYPTSGGQIELHPGMTLAIEPMINAGRPEVVLEQDGWTFVTADRTLSVHFEHTVLIRPEGPEILTARR